MSSQNLEDPRYADRDAGRDSPALALTDVSVIPEVAGASIIHLLGLVIVAILVLFPAVLSLSLLPWLLVVDAVLVGGYFTAVLATPSHLSPREYATSRLRERYGQTTSVYDAGFEQTTDPDDYR